MATILLSAAGAAAGASLGGSVLGLSSAVIGRAVGATIGRVIDSKILGAGSPTVDVGRIDRFRLTGASEGAPISTVHGRARIAGQVIWSSRFREDVSVSGGGKGAPSQPNTRTYSYSVSLAIALCEGEITRVGRIWADGAEIAKTDLNLRVYKGRGDQLPDPKIEAVEGAGLAPAYRGTAYVVLEDLQLAPYGNRVPQFTFEVVRTGAGDLAESIRAVAMMPGTGEYALATTPVHFSDGPGRARSANVNTPSGETDFATSLEALREELPDCGATSLIVSWFGDDLRCDQCRIRPKVEQSELDGVGMPWSVSGLSRSGAEAVAQVSGRPVYGGTPADASVIEAIGALGESGQAVMFYPFVLMEQAAGNGLSDPWSEAADQPAYPWRGRITTSVAPGRAGSPDGTSVAAAEVAAFFGSATAAEFTVDDGRVAYTGSDGFSYRRFILHYAHLCAVAGGVDAFCIGSEMRSLTQIRGAGNSFPVVAALRDLAVEVRGILGPDVKIGYAADWSEYFGYQPQDGSGDVFFHLDPLWADPAIDFVGIDNYMPASDWRDGTDHADAHWGAIYNRDYLKANITGGDGYDWYYHAPEAEAVQLRTPITDGAFGEPWVFRYKDLAGWWSKSHHERIGGVRQVASTDWVPGSKPLWFTEIGCAAVDKGTNQPNKFLDPKSSESGLPKYSSGARDDLIQMQFLTAVAEFWSNEANNPAASAYDGRMVDTSRMFVWAWDARPFPHFPGNRELWSDGENYARGHWLTGRVSARSLAATVAEICASGGVEDVDVSALYGAVRGYAPAGGADARAVLQPLLLAYGIDAIEKDGRLTFRNRDGRVFATLDDEGLAWGEAPTLVSYVRDPDAETAGRVRIDYVEADGDYEVRSVESAFPDERTVSIARTEVPLVLTAGEGRVLVERWLAEARVARDGASFALPPSSDVNAGDIVRLERDGSDGLYRVDRIEDAGLRLARSVRVEPGIYQPLEGAGDSVSPKPVLAPLPVWPVLLDLPLLTGDEDPVAPWIAATAEPWPGAVAVYGSNDGDTWAYESELSQAAVMGQTLTELRAARPGVWDRGAALGVRLTRGALASLNDAALLSGGNVAVISAHDGLQNELFQFRDTELTGPDTWSLSMRLRGQRGTDGTMPSVWPVGSTFTVLDLAVRQLPVSPEMRGIARRYRIGPAGKPVDHGSYVELSQAAEGLGLRPYAPVHVRASRDATGGLEMSWVRRTRIDGDRWDGPDVPLGEVGEAYLFRVAVNGVVRREGTVSSSRWIYSAADQLADGTATGADFEVAQISDRFGPGLFGRIGIND